jgi:phenylacetic acid degradation operon negative regulatory protein
MTAAAEVAGPRLSRRHAVGAESARGLLFTVLGEFVLPTGGAAWTSTLIDVLGRLDVEPKTTRQALMRTAADGWLEAVRSGRRTRWQLTAAAVELLTDGARRIYGFSGATPDWDGRWLLVIARAPETDRGARHVLRSRLTWAGFGTPAPGVWLSPHADRLDEADRALAESGLGPEAQVFLAEHAGLGRLDAMVRQAWDLDALAAAYEEFRAEFRPPRAPDSLARVVELVHAWRRFPWIDPGLPTQLLPPRWGGVQAAQLFRRRHERWSPPARAEWQRIGG